MNPSLAPTGLARRTRRLAVVPATAALLLAMGLCSNAQASPCLAEAAGDLSLNCTANDFGVSSVSVDVIVDDGCQFEGDTFTFNGSLTTFGTKPNRYDVGFYIGNDGTQAYLGECTVGLIPPGTGTADDGDACGDFDGTSLSVPIQNVTSACTDTNGDGYYDVALCTAWDNNTKKTCNGIEDAIPNTPSKCSCQQVETNQPVTPPGPVDEVCLTNSDCASDDNVCTDEVCDPGAPGADLFGCTHPANTASCDNGLFCDGADVCSGGTCGHAGDPCVGGGVCGDSCNEVADNCFDPSGTVCRASAGVCDAAETCTGSSSTCPADAFLTTTCRASTGICDAAEVCSGSSATCPVDSLASAGTVCRASAGICDAAETCTGTSGTCPADAFLTTTCRASTGVCDAAEVCSGSSATCPADGFSSAGTICRSDAGDCDVAETCTGTSNTCPANGFEPAGTACTTDGNVCTDDVCNATGGCTHTSNTAPCDDGLFCTVGDVCTGGACGGAPRDCTDSIACTVGACDEGTDSCIQQANDFLCNDADDCTQDSCAIAQGGCVSENICASDICRSPGYWSTHSGYEKKNSVNVGQLVIDAVGPLQVCGETISATSNMGEPYVAGLGLSSNLEGLCMRSQGVHQRQLFRQLTAAALNCAISGDDCDVILAKYIDVSFTECSNLCAGLPSAPGAPSVGECVAQLDCFNNGGQTVGGECAIGTCANDSSLSCGADFGACPTVNDLPQECVGFANSCRDADLCNEDIGVCPAKTSASSPRACSDARKNDCTIDSCN